MNLAQLIAPDWAQDGCKPRHAPPRPEWVLPPLGLVRRDSNEIKNSERVPLLTPPPAAKVLLRPSPKAEAVVGRGRGTQPVTEANPWPRGKSGLRYEALRILAARPNTSLLVGELRDRLQSWRKTITTPEVNNCVRLLIQQRLVGRSGKEKSYRYIITPLGEQALKA